MNADEIREKWEQTKQGVIRPADWEAWALCEIAAQLAELNEYNRELGKANKKALKGLQDVVESMKESLK